MKLLALQVATAKTRPSPALERKSQGWHRSGLIPYAPQLIETSSEFSSRDEEQTRGRRKNADCYVPPRRTHRASLYKRIVGSLSKMSLKTAIHLQTEHRIAAVSCYGPPGAPFVAWPHRAKGGERSIPGSKFTTPCRPSRSPHPGISHTAPATGSPAPQASAPPIR